MHATNVFSLFGIQIRHPEHWRVWCDPKSPLKFDRGLVKLDESSQEIAFPYTLTVSWTECIKEDFDLMHYHQQLVNEVNKAKDFTLEGSEASTTESGHHAMLTKLSSLSGKGLFKIKKDRVTGQVQFAFYDRASNRLVVADLCCHPTRLAEEEALWRAVLQSIDSDVVH